MHYQPSVMFSHVLGVGDQSAILPRSLRLSRYAGMLDKAIFDTPSLCRWDCKKSCMLRPED